MIEDISGFGTAVKWLYLGPSAALILILNPLYQKKIIFWRNIALTSAVFFRVDRINVKADWLSLL